MSSKLRIRIGEIEIDFEGTEEFIKQELPELLKTATTLFRDADTMKAAASRKNKKGGAAGGKYLNLRLPQLPRN
jgi:hypothetical protein